MANPKIAAGERRHEAEAVAPHGEGGGAPALVAVESLRHSAQNHFLVNPATRASLPPSESGWAADSSEVPAPAATTPRDLSARAARTRDLRVMRSACRRRPGWSRLQKAYKQRPSPATFAYFGTTAGTMGTRPPCRLVLAPDATRLPDGPSLRSGSGPTARPPTAAHDHHPHSAADHHDHPRRTARRAGPLRQRHRHPPAHRPAPRRQRPRLRRTRHRRPAHLPR